MTDELVRVYLPATVPLLARLREEYPETSVILLTGQGNVEDAVRSVMEEGAFYYFEKPINTRQLKAVLQRAIERAVERERERLWSEKPKNDFADDDLDARSVRLTEDGELTDSTIQQWERDDKPKRSRR